MADDDLDTVFGTRHVLRDLHTTTEQISETRSVSVTPVVDALRDPDGRPTLGLMATVADVNASLVALLAGRPEWTATVSLTLHTARGRTRATADRPIGGPIRGPVVVDARLERAGSKIVVVRTALHDGDGRSPDEILDQMRDVSVDPGPLLAVGVATFTRIPASASRAAGRFDPAAMIGRRRGPSPEDPVPEVPLADRIGWQTIDPSTGTMELVATPYVQNSFGAVTGGVHAMLMQAAAEGAHPGMVATAVELHYLAQARGGRLRTRIERLRADCVEVRLLDDDDVTITLGTVTVVQAP